ncbi:hypothetical protein JL475_06415 [Streptomyces sp. M2CJ-2]|uniref:hypothetical protein n=1 Tax=Streptomyces sp. M2CJ-2 TaxID=2803948 RepID=UPI0019234222|nr:hypothetical protein [Streptomyces sp. M2CJ-2]MBL3665640.1 hypothetical protein [Streptomyces sp. M2CJ-2]
MAKFEEPEGIGNEVATPAEGQGQDGGGVPVQPRAEMVVVLAQQGLARNEIARRTGISTATVSRIAKANGITFDRARMERPLKARIHDLKVAQAGIAEGLQEDVAVARMLLRTARTHRDYAFASKAISDLTQAVQRMTPEVTQEDALEETKDFLLGLREDMQAARQAFETEHGIPLGSPEATRLHRKALGLDGNNEQP